MDKLKQKAIELGAEDFGPSKTAGKRFYVIYKNKKLNFASKVGSTFYDHGDNDKRQAWVARHSRVKNKYGEYVIGLKTSPSYWSHKILWS